MAIKDGEHASPISENKTNPQKEKSGTTFVTTDDVAEGNREEVEKSLEHER